MSFQPLACGAFTGNLGYTLETNFTDVPRFADLAAGAEIPILIDTRVDGGRSRGTLHIADGAAAALLIEGGVGSYWVAQMGTPVFSPAEVPIDRSKGYPDASVRLENMTECPGAHRATMDPAQSGPGQWCRGCWRFKATSGSTGRTAPPPRPMRSH